MITHRHGHEVGKYFLQSDFEYKPRQFGFHTEHHGGQEKKSVEGREVVCCTDVEGKALPQK